MKTKVGTPDEERTVQLHGSTLMNTGEASGFLRDFASRSHLPLAKKMNAITRHGAKYLIMLHGLEAFDF